MNDEDGPPPGEPVSYYNRIITGKIQEKKVQTPS
jgi:hypothetical protein